MNSANVQRITVEHPTLAELEVVSYEFTADDALALIDQLNSLERFRFQMEMSEYTNFVSRLDGGKWSVELNVVLRFDDNHTSIVLKRRTRRTSLLSSY